MLIVSCDLAICLQKKNIIGTIWFEPWELLHIRNGVFILICVELIEAHELLPIQESYYLAAINNA